MGLVTICDVVDLAMLQANYELSSLINMSHHPPERHAEIDILCINPIFAHRWVGAAGCVHAGCQTGKGGGQCAGAVALRTSTSLCGLMQALVF